MRRIFILLVLALLAVDAAAQQYPERRQVRKGNRAYEKGNYQDAAGRYMRALGADPSSFEAQYNLGNALHRQEMYDQAAQVQQQAAADSLAAPAVKLVGVRVGEAPCKADRVHKLRHTAVKLSSLHFAVDEKRFGDKLSH